MSPVGHLHLSDKGEGHRGEIATGCGRVEHARTEFHVVQGAWRAAAERRRHPRDRVTHGRLAHGPRIPAQQQVSLHQLNISNHQLVLLIEVVQSIFPC